MPKLTVEINTTLSEQETKDILNKFFGDYRVTKVEDSLYPINLIHKGYLIDSADIAARSLEEAYVIAVGMFQKAAPYDVSRGPEDPEFLLVHDIDLSKVQIDR